VNCEKIFVVLCRFLAKFPFVCEDDTGIRPYTVTTVWSLQGLYLWEACYYQTLAYLSVNSWWWETSEVQSLRT